MRINTIDIIDAFVTIATTEERMRCIASQHQKWSLRERPLPENNFYLYLLHEIEKIILSP